jgi:hypothetical protein
MTLELGILCIMDPFSPPQECLLIELVEVLSIKEEFESLQLQDPQLIRRDLKGQMMTLKKTTPEILSLAQLRLD